jgi:hypothetical protein
MCERTNVMVKRSTREKVRNQVDGWVERNVVGAEERAEERVLQDGDKRVEALCWETSAGRDRAEQTEYTNLEVLSPDPDRVGAKAEAKELKVPKHHVLRDANEWTLTLDTHGTIPVFV